MSEEKEREYLETMLDALEKICQVSQPETEVQLHQICGELEHRGWKGHPDIDFFRGQWNMKQGNLHKAGILLESALGKLDCFGEKEYTYTKECMEQVFLWIAIANFHGEHNPQKSVQYAVTLLRVNPYSEGGLLILLTCFQRQKHRGNNIDETIGPLEKIYDFDKLKDLLCIYKVARQVNFQLLTKYIYDLFPKEVKEKLSKNHVDKE